MKRINLGLFLVTPSIFFVFLFLIFPLFFTIYCSMFELKYLVFDKSIGFMNYFDLASDSEVIHSVCYTLIVSMISVTISIVCGLFLALLIDSQKSISSYFLQILGLIPWITSMVVAALLWRWIFDRDLGLLNYIISSVGFNKINILGNALNASSALMFVISWRTFGYAMVIILAGLKGISQDILEAAKTDGANNFNLLWRIKIPMLKTPLLVSTIVITLSNFNNITVPLTLTGGGPGGATTLINLLSYRLGFVYYNFGMSSALSCIVFVINISIIVFYVRMVKYDV